MDLVDQNGKVPRRRVVKFDSENNLHIICPSCKGAHRIGNVCGEETQAAPIKKSHTVKLVYIPGANRG